MASICHVASALQGGPASSITRLINHQLSAGHRIDLIYSIERDPDISDLKLKGRVRTIAWNVGREISSKDVAAVSELRKMLVQGKYDVVHLHCAKAGFLGRIASRGLGGKVIYSPRGISFFRRDVGLLRRSAFWILEYVGSMFGGISVACSDSELRALRFFPGAKVLIRNAVEIAEIEHCAASRSKSLGSDLPQGGASGLTVGICGRICEAKNPELVRSIVEASPPDWRFVWIGDGPLREILRGTSVDITGWLSRGEALGVLATCDVMLQASLWEGLPNAVLEAMALKIPVVASRCEGNRDLVVEGVNGFAFQHATEAVAALKRLADADARAAMGERARKFVNDYYNLSDALQKWDAIYSLSPALEDCAA